MGFRYGSLYVVETPSEKEPINRALKQLDDRLFVERQITLDNEWVWCVVCDVGDQEPPLTILEFRDDDGKPIPYLTDRIVYRMAAMERDGNRLTSRVIEQNKQFQRRKSDEALRENEDVFKDMASRLSGKKSPVLFRSQSLRMARDKERARGKKI